MRVEPEPSEERTPPSLASNAPCPYYHVSFAVADIDQARSDLGPPLRVTWSDVASTEAAGWPIRVCYSLEGPPYLELIEGQPGSPWDATEGTRFDHLGFWSTNIESDARRLARWGCTVESSTAKFAFVRGSQTSVRIELVTEQVQRSFRDRFGTKSQT